MELVKSLHNMLYFVVELNKYENIDKVAVTSALNIECQ